MTDIPDEFILKALAVHREMYPSRFPPGKSPAIADNIEPIARALMAAEARGYNAGLKEAAKKVTEYLTCEVNALEAVVMSLEHDEGECEGESR